MNPQLLQYSHVRKPRYIKNRLLCPKEPLKQIKTLNEKERENC